jgi:hypothetical protein
MSHQLDINICFLLKNYRYFFVYLSWECSRALDHAVACKIPPHWAAATIRLANDLKPCCQSTVVL